MKQNACGTTVTRNYCSIHDTTYHSLPTPHSFESVTTQSAFFKFITSIDSVSKYNMNTMFTRRLISAKLLPSKVHATSFSTKSPMKSLSPVFKKRLTLVVLFGFVGGVYYTAISKMGETDELGALIDKETMATGQEKSN